MKTTRVNKGIRKTGEKLDPAMGSITQPLLGD